MAPMYSPSSCCMFCMLNCGARWNHSGSRSWLSCTSPRQKTSFLMHFWAPHAPETATILVPLAALLGTKRLSWSCAVHHSWATEASLRAEAAHVGFRWPRPS